MSRTQLDFNSGDLAFQEIITSRPNRNSATRVVSQSAVWPVTATFPSTRLYIHVEKDFQSHHMQIYSSTLMGGQEIIVYRVENRENMSSNDLPV